MDGSASSASSGWQRYSISSGARDFLTKPKKMFIGGEWAAPVCGDYFDNYEPASGEVLGKAPRGKSADINNAVHAARHAFEDGQWPKLKPADRQNLMLILASLVEARRQELAEIESIDNGKPLAEAFIDVDGLVALMRYMAGWATKIDGRTASISAPGDNFAYTLKQPVGVVGAIIPWNFPLGMAGWKIVPPLITGCTAILKPAEQTPFSILRLAELVEEAGYPKGVLNVVTGFGHEAGAALSQHKGIDKIAFTGSTEIGKLIARNASDNLTRVTLELGGKSPLIILKDCDIERAAVGAASAIYFNQGQTCCAGSRAYIHKSIYEKVTERITEIADNMTLAPGIAPGCDMGPLVSSEQRDRVTEYIELGVSEGAHRATSEKTQPEQGYFVRPTLLADTTNEMKVVREEIFGPVLVAAPFEDVEDALQLANDSPYGLGASIWSNDLSAVHNIIPKIQSGLVWVNTHNVVDPSLPFGGCKASGYGRELGPEQLEAYLETKSVWIEC